MAIIKMKRLSLLALNQDRLRILSKMQKLGCVEVSPASEAELDRAIEQDGARLDEATRLIARLDLAILRLMPFDPIKKGMLSLRPVAQPDQMTAVLAARGELIAAIERLEAIERTRGELRSRATRDAAQLEQLRPWENLEVPLDELKDTKTTRVALFTLPSRAYDGFLSDMSTASAQYVEKISESRENVNVLIAVHRSAVSVLDEAVRRAGASGVSFPEMRGTVLFAIDQLHTRNQRAAEINRQLDEEVKSLADHLPMLRMLRDIEAMERDRLESGAKCLHTRSAFLLTGWVPETYAKPLESALKKISPSCEIEFSDPEDGESPPVFMKNGPAVAPFESIVRMFSMPDPNGIDPTAVMTPFWACFFGMMVSDAGYGVLIFLLMWFVQKKLKRKGTLGKMAFVLAIGGLFTIFWGAMYGSWFSIEGIRPLLIAPMEKPLEMMILCMGMGVFQIFSGLGVAMYMNIKRGKPLDALYDQGFWIMLLVGLGLLFVNDLAGKILALAGFFGILLTAGRAKTKNPIKRILSGLGALYGISSYVSDILSYARLFGMGLATGVIGLVFNTLAGMAMGSPVGVIFGVIILVVGHTFNLGINALGAYVHSCRLQYIEFFSKFYESGGRDFTPLTQNTRYVDVAEAE